MGGRKKGNLSNLARSRQKAIRGSGSKYVILEQDLGTWYNAGQKKRNSELRIFHGPTE